MINFLVKAIASGFGSGYSPVASGTAGSLVAALFYWYLFPDSAVFMAAACLLTLAVSVYTAGRAEKLYGNHDDGRIVIDEAAGYFFAVIFLPKTLLFACAAFVLFRFFDVVKPWFIRKSQDWPGGWGITMDDVFAGIFTNIILQAVYYVFF